MTFIHNCHILLLFLNFRVSISGSNSITIPGLSLGETRPPEFVPEIKVSYINSNNQEVTYNIATPRPRYRGSGPLHYGNRSLTREVSGGLYFLEVNQTGNSRYQLCSKHLTSKVPPVPYIALVTRGGCSFKFKSTTAKLYNASAIIVYDPGFDDSGGFKMADTNPNIVSVSITNDLGSKLSDLLHNDTYVTVRITPMPVASSDNMLNGHWNKTSVMFVSISFIILMVVSLVWLVFYYVQRFRYVQSKERLSRQLYDAAKKAISRIALKTLKSIDKEVESKLETCVVCMDRYRVGEIVRVMPCSHVFHKNCVDPWLLLQHSCPMCKMDILKHFGLEVSGSIALNPADMTNAEVQVGHTDPSWWDLQLQYLNESEYSDDIQVVHIDLPVSLRIEAANRSSSSNPKSTSSQRSSNVPNPIHASCQSSELSPRTHSLVEVHQPASGNSTPKLANNNSSSPTESRRNSLPINDACSHDNQAPVNVSEAINNCSSDKSEPSLGDSPFCSSPSPFSRRRRSVEDAATIKDNLKSMSRQMLLNSGEVVDENSSNELKQRPAVQVHYEDDIHAGSQGGVFQSDDISSGSAASLSPDLAEHRSLMNKNT